MANINDNIRSKKLYKSGDTTRAYKDSSGEIVVPSKVATEIAAVSDITELLNDHDNYTKSIYFLKEIENMRQDIEELHAFIKDAFGKNSSEAASKGDKGDIGLQGPQGLKGDKGDTGEVGPRGATGPAGSDGEDGSGDSTKVYGCKGEVLGTLGNMVLCEDTVRYEILDPKSGKQVDTLIIPRIIKQGPSPFK